MSTPVEQDAAALELIEHAAGRGDQHVGAAIEHLVLVLEGDAADQQGHVEPVVLAVFLEILGDLRGEFARRLEDEGTGHAGPGTTAFKQGQHGQHERRRLAGAGLRDADNVLLFKDMRDGLRLNIGGLGVTGSRDRIDHLGGKAEPGKVICQISGPLKSERGWSTSSYLRRCGSTEKVAKYSRWSGFADNKRSGLRPVRGRARRGPEHSANPLRVNGICGGLINSGQ